MSTITILLIAWFGLNVALFAIRLYVTAAPKSQAERDIGRYPRLIS